MAAESGYADVNGTRLFYELSGRGEAVVFIHRLGLDRRLWDQQFTEFARHFRVLRYDLRGFGRSAPPGDEPYRRADDLTALLDHFHMDSANLVGLSLGGWVALTTAWDQPDRVKSLVLADAYLAGWPMSPEWEADFGPIWREAKQIGARASCRRWHELSLFASARAHPQAGAALATMIDDWSGWQFMHDDPEATQRWPSTPLEAVRAPTLVVIGEHDLADFHAIADALLAIPLARKIVLPGAGHLAPLEAPRQFNMIVLSFLEFL